MVFFGFVEIPVWTVLIPTAGFLLYKYGSQGLDYWEKQGIKGPKPYPFIGTLFNLMKHRSFSKVDPDCLEKYGKTWGEYTGRQPVLVTSDLEFIRIAMIKEFNSMPNRGSSPDLETTFNHFLTTLNDDHWKHVRNSLSPTFTTGKLKEMEPLINNCVKRLVHHLEEKEGEFVNIKNHCGGFTMDVIASTAFGIEVDSQSNPNSEIVKHANKLMNIKDEYNKEPITTRIKEYMGTACFLLLPSWLFKRMYQLGLVPGIISADAMGYFKELLEQVISTEGATNDGRTNFLQMSLEKLVDADPNDPETKSDDKGALWTTKGLTKDDLIANAILFFFAGYETTASSLHYVFFELAHNPEIQQRLYEDIRTYCTSENATYDELAKLTYLDWIIDEALRLYSPAQRFDRMTTREVKIDGITLKPKTGIMASVMNIHYNPEIWPEPEKFIPERFSPESKQGRHSCAWVPFGVGNRNCIGMRLALLEMKAAIVGVLWNLEVLTTPETHERPITSFATNFGNNPLTPIKLKFQKRQE